MHRRGQSADSFFRTIFVVAIAALTIAAVAIPTFAQNSVPPTAVQAAKMPQYASRLAYPAKRVLPPEPLAKQRAKARRGPLQGNDIYDNGPINGNTDAWTINFGYIVSDSLAIANDQTSVTGMSFGAWLFSGDTLTSVEVSITSGENGGTSYFDQTVTFTQGSCTTNEYGYNVCTETGSFNGPTLNAGTYWVNLQNATVPSGDPVYWDENSGVGCTGQGCPSSASANTVGSIPSESFTILGNTTTTTSSSTACDIYSEGGFHFLRDLGQSTGPSGVSLDQEGNLYGTLSAAGNYAQGLLYELSQRAGHWFFSSLYSFLGNGSGSSPNGVIVGPERELFGAASGGIQNCGTSGTSYCGVIYEATPAATPCTTALCNPNQTTIYQFTGNTDAWGGAVTAYDSAGNLYGISGGSVFPQGGAYGKGAIFELIPSQGSWTETILHSFTGGTDGAAPSSLLMGHDGNLYGTTYSGGDPNCAQYGGMCGVVFQLVPSGNGWTENILYSFTGGLTDGGDPGGLIQDSHGNLYGHSQCDTQFGGCSAGSYASGLIFELSPPGGINFLDVHSTDSEFCPGNAQWSGFTELAVDQAGNLYGAVNGSGYYGSGWLYCGAVGSTSYLLQPLVWSNQDIFGNLTSDALGNLYGTIGSCGPGNDAMVWQYSP